MSSVIFSPYFQSPWACHPAVVFTNKQVPGLLGGDADLRSVCTRIAVASVVVAAEGGLIDAGAVVIVQQVVAVQGDLETVGGGPQTCAHMQQGRATGQKSRLIAGLGEKPAVIGIVQPGERETLLPALDRPVVFDAGVDVPVRREFRVVAGETLPTAAAV